LSFSDMDANTLYLIVARDNLTRRTLLERLLAEKLPGDQDRRLGFYESIRSKRMATKGC